jgi:hypothetical protein
VSPAEIYFDLFIDGEIDDIDLIVDHLSAPAVPNDGLGMFNHTYSITTENIQSSILKKFENDDSSYYLNSPVSFLDPGKEHWEVVLNKLKGPECYYCKNTPDQWILVDNDSELHLNFISVLACQEHKSLGRISEISSGHSDEELDYHTSYNEKKFIMKDIVDENNNKLFTKNIEVQE